MMISTHISSNNDVKGARTSRKGSSSGNGQRQADRGRYHAKSCLDSHREGGCEGLSPSTSTSGTNTAVSAKNSKKLVCLSRKMKKKMNEEKKVKIRIANINVRTCQDDLKLALIVRTASRLGIDVLALQEVRRTGFGSIVFDDDSIQGWQFVWSGHKRKREHGVATLLAPHVELEEYKEHLAAMLGRKY